MTKHSLTNRITLLAVITAIAATPSLGEAQLYHVHDDHGVTLHTSNRWKECSFQISSSLTQAAWRQFTQEAGVVTYFRPIADARPMGRGNWELSAMQWKTNIDDSDPAWNDTFVHPDSTHWLFEGSGLQFPGLMGRVGVSKNIDVGAYVTKNPNANYGFYGAQMQYNLSNNEVKGWAASVRGSFVSLYGPEEIDFTVYGADFVGSKRFTAGKLAVSPYATVSTYLSASHEKSPLVTLSNEQVFGAMGTVGVSSEFSIARVGVEYSMSKVSSFSLKLGIGF